ncbi:MAG: LPS export ABC transporter permease LptG [Thiotrichales bacterium]|nr:LPS export ABC transporter permease LptG [Thiotrichales bacterium]
MNRIERYLGSVVMMHTLLVLFVLVVIMAFFEFVSQLSRLSEVYGLSDITFYTVLRMPMFAFDLFSVALLIGMLMGLGRLASQSELTVIRVSGWSVSRIFYAVLKTALVLWLIMTFLGEIIAPASEAYANKYRGEILQKGISIGNETGFWLKEPDRFIHVDRIISTTELQGVSVYLKQGDDIKQLITAPKAKYIDDEWVLLHGNEQNLTFKSVPNQALQEQGLNSPGTITLLDWQSQSIERQAFQFPLKPEVIESLNIGSRFMSIVDLHYYIQFLNDNELEALNYELAFWRKLANPFVIIGMVAIVFPLIFGLQRQANTGQRIFVGILIGIGFHLFNQIFGNVSIIYGFPAVVGAFLPATILLMLSYYFIRKL